MKLFVVGVGPGNPKLITLEGYNIINNSKLIFYPTGGRDALALSVVRKLISLDDKVLVELHFPMKRGALSEHWEELVLKIFNNLQKLKEGVFITLGDPAFYCTFYYLYPYLLRRGVDISFVPGISSFSAGSSCFSLPLALGEEIVAIVPGERVNTEWDRLKFFDTIVVLKAKRYLKDIVERAEKEGFCVFVGYRITQEDEVMLSNLKTPVAEEMFENFDYFTLAILKRSG